MVSNYILAPKLSDISYFQWESIQTPFFMAFMALWIIYLIMTKWKHLQCPSCIFFSLARQPALCKRLHDSKFLPFHIDEAQCASGEHSKLQKYFWIFRTLPMPWPQMSTESCLDFKSWFLVWHALWLVESYVYTGVYISRSCLINWIFSQFNFFPYFVMLHYCNGQNVYFFHF